VIYDCSFNARVSTASVGMPAHGQARCRTAPSSGRGCRRTFQVLERLIQVPVEAEVVEDLVGVLLGVSPARCPMSRGWVRCRAEARCDVPRAISTVSVSPRLASCVNPSRHNNEQTHARTL